MFASHMRYALRRPDPPPASRPRRAADPSPVTIRLALDVEPALDELAELDGRILPGGPRLVAEIDGRPVAALALADRSAVADPMRPTAGLVELLRVRARQLEPAT